MIFGAVGQAVMELDLLTSGNGTPVSLANQTEPALTSLDQAEDAGVGHPLLTRFQRNLRFDDTTLCALLFVYVVLIAFGTLANGLIILAVMRQRKMRLLRHALIVNLAFSDILLCLLTMPLTLMQLVTLYWPLGRWEFKMLDPREWSGTSLKAHCLRSKCTCEGGG